MKFNKILQKIYKYLIRSFFKSYYGEIILLKPKIEKSLKSIKLRFVKNTYFNKKYFFYEILDGKIYSDNVQNVGIIKDNYLIQKPSYQQHLGYYLKAKRNFVIKNGTPKILKKFDGKVLNCAQGASGENYFHWLFDILPKIKISSNIIDLDKINYFYLPEIRFKFQTDTLKKLSIQKNKIINSNKYRYIQAEKLLVPEHPWFNKGYLLHEYNYMPSWIVKWLRKIFLYKNQTLNKNNLIFIDRSDSNFNRSRILNNENLWNALKSLGFKKILLSKEDFKNQVSIFQNAKIIIGATGAGLANITFCRKNTKVIELRPKLFRTSRVYERISKINHLRHKTLIMNHDSQSTNFFVPIKKIIKNL